MQRWTRTVLLVVAAGLVVCALVVRSDAVGWGPLGAGLSRLAWYLEMHLLQTLVPAFLLAGLIAAFVSPQRVAKYLGPAARKPAAYAAASAGGSALTVCSCMVLPLVAGVHRLGAGIGPAATLLVAGPAVNVLALVLTVSVVGPGLGAARAVVAIGGSVVIGLTMAMLFQRSEARRATPGPVGTEAETGPRGWRVVVLAGVLVVFTALGNWARTGDVRAVLLCCPGGLSQEQWSGVLVSQDREGIEIIRDDGEARRVPWSEVIDVRYDDRSLLGQAVRYRVVWLSALAAGFLASAGVLLRPRDWGRWATSSLDLSRQILPWMIIGIVAAGMLLGDEVRGGLVDRAWVESMVGGNGVTANAIAALLGALMYFATLTEIVFVRELMEAGMGDGPSLALLIAGPAVSLPSMLAIYGIFGLRRTAAFVALVVVLAVVCGWGYGAVSW